MKSIIMPLLTALIITAAIVFIAFYVKKENALQSDSSNWIGTSAVITSSKVRRDWDKNQGAAKTIYWFEVQYNYVVDDKTYQGKRYTFHGNPSFSNKSEAKKLLEKFPVGKKITIYYQPENPEEAVIKR